MYDSDDKKDIGEIVGVVDGYFQNSLDQEVKPTIFNCDQVGNFIFIRIQKGDVQNIVNKVSTEFKNHFKDQFLEYYFLDDFFNAQYQSHIRLFRCVVLFCLMAVFIASLSLFGLVLMIAASRTKEIGIRKLNGAKVSEIFMMLNKDFMVLVAVAFAVATPVTWFVMHKWLQSFAFRTDLSWWVFALAGFLALLIALITVSWQSWKAASRNPVEALRYE